MGISCAIDPHCHSVASGHAFSTVWELATAAAEKGLTAIAVTDHAPKMPGSAQYLHFLNLPKLPKKIKGITVFKGVELNILNERGSVDLKKGVYKQLDVVIASLHVPCFEPSLEEVHTEAVIAAMQNPYIKIIGHLGDPRYLFDIERVVKTAKQTGTAIEINNVSLNPESNVRSGGEGLVRAIALECKRQSVHVVMGSDAHYHEDVGEISYAKQLLEQIDFPPQLVLNTSVELFSEFVISG